MKTSTMRLARRLAAKIELNDVQQALMEDAYGARNWAGVFFDDDFSLRQIAQKRREIAGRNTLRGRAGANANDADPLGHPGHDPDRPVARDIDPGDLAICLMLLPGLLAVGARSLVTALHAVQPIVAVRGNVHGFERRFGVLLDQTFHTKRHNVGILHLDDPEALSIRPHGKSSETVMLHIRSVALGDATPAQIRRCLSVAMRARMPIVITREDPAFVFPVHMASAVDLAIDAVPLDWPMLAELIDAKVGIKAQAVLAAAPGYAIDLARLSLDDLTLAIRPGRGLETILSTLAQLAAAPRDEPADDDDGSSRNGSSSSSRRNRNGTAGTGSVRIDPEPLPPTATAKDVDAMPPDADIDPAAAKTQDAKAGSDDGREDARDGPGKACGSNPAPADVANDPADSKRNRQAKAARADPVKPAKPATSVDDPAPSSVGKEATAGEGNAVANPSTPALAVPMTARVPVRARKTAVISVETLAGYGKARDWALDLKADIAHWKAGSLPWSDLSTKLLLSGPPGTGKTTFARALGNTLQLPVFATSVSTWLEASYLGDVLKRMRACFEEAGRARPCILFIDEIDGIGRRQDQRRNYADYWNSLVNKMLELMDGAIRSEGIIVVGATNRPDDIEPALRRSGRLETHIVIPRPDMKALEGIVAFHLGDDLADVLASAPDGMPLAGAVMADQESRTLRLLARGATGMTGADIERILREERQRCRRTGTAMAFDPLRAALRSGRPDLSPALRGQIAIHEAGHAIALRALDLGTQDEITIEGADGGLSSSIIDTARVQSEDRLMALMAMKLAGRAAETVCGLAPLSGSGAGPGSDLHAATHLALELECRAGFGGDEPLLYVDPASINALHLARPDAYRNANARLETAFASARRVIEEHRDAHMALVEALLAMGTLDGKEVDAILQVYMPRTGRPHPTEKEQATLRRPGLEADVGGVADG